MWNILKYSLCEAVKSYMSPYETKGHFVLSLIKNKKKHTMNDCCKNIAYGLFCRKIYIYRVSAQHEPHKTQIFIRKVFVHQNLLPGKFLLFLPLVRCHVSGVPCHVSGVTCNFSFLFRKSGGACQWRVCYQRGLSRLVLCKRRLYYFMT